MTLKKSCLLAIIGISYTLLNKILHMIFPVIYQIENVGGMFALLSALVPATTLVFIIYLQKEKIPKSNIKLNQSANVVVTFAALLLALRLLMLMTIFPGVNLFFHEHFRFLFKIFNSKGIITFQTIAYWLNAVVVLLFLVRFRNAVKPETGALKNHSTFFIWGIWATLVIRTPAAIFLILGLDTTILKNPPFIVLLISTLVFFYVSVVSIVFFRGIYQFSEREFLG